MKVPLSWLKEYIPTQLSAEQISNALTVVGLEGEGVHDGVLEVALTPNLSHCASIRGIARELAAVTEESLHSPHFAVIENGKDPIQKHISVTVENPTACPRYACRLITGVRVGPSPAWLKERIEQCGMRSVNNVVDITNLVLLELGHPLHAFDYDQLEGRQINVRNARKGETITTLDGKTHYPTEETLLICDGKMPVAIAGIMGSLNTEVGEKTTTVLLESAYFEPAQIRRASKRMGIHSEASARFERGCDPNGVLEALERATAWICEIAQGTAQLGHVDVAAQTFSPILVTARLSRINKLLGTHLAMSEVETILRRLRFTITHTAEDNISVKVPTYRHDVHHEIDLVEEVARLYGYDNLHKREQPRYRTGTLPHSPEYLLTHKVRCRLIAEGLQEFLTCDLISPTQAAWISTDTFPSRSLIKLLNPASAEQSVMRPSLLPGMLNVVRYNEDHGIESVCGFEVGRVHFTSKERFYEPPVVAIVLAGDKAPFHWENKQAAVDFFDLKGIVENFLSGLKVSPFKFEKSTYANFHPGRQAAIKVDGVEVGIMGEVHPSTLKQAGLHRPVYYAEINLEEVQRAIHTEIHMEPLPQFPASSRDWTVTVADRLPVGDLLNEILKSGSSLLESVNLLDIYRSSALGSEVKNVTFRFVYRDRHKTISLAEVDSEHQRITQKISESLPGKSP